MRSGRIGRGMSLGRFPHVRDVRRGPGRPRGKSPRHPFEGEPLIVSAHLDTVFPPETDVVPKRSGDRIQAPGISDDGRGLAVVWPLPGYLTEVPFALPFPILFVATVGEEGPGDLRGVRHLLTGDGERPSTQGVHIPGRRGDGSDHPPWGRIRPFPDHR